MSHSLLPVFTWWLQYLKLNYKSISAKTYLQNLADQKWVLILLWKYSRSESGVFLIIWYLLVINFTFKYLSTFIFWKENFLQLKYFIFLVLLPYEKVFCLYNALYIFHPILVCSYFKWKHILKVNIVSNFYQGC